MKIDTSIEGVADGITTALMGMLARPDYEFDYLTGVSIAGTVIHRLVLPVTNDTESFCVDHPAFGNLIFKYRDLLESGDEDGIGELRSAIRGSVRCKGRNLSQAFR